jgi:hypothetical protein
MNSQKLSPKFDTSKLLNPTLEDYIDVYEDQIMGWYLSFAKAMNADQHAGFAALQIVFSYFEGYWISRTGCDSRNKSEEFFTEGFYSVFPEVRIHAETAPQLVQNTISALYKDGRCGFFHSGLTRKRFMLRDAEAEEPIIRVGADPENLTKVLQVFIDRRQFVDRICSHFAVYIAKLRNPAESELREHFVSALKLLHGENLRLN